MILFASIFCALALHVQAATTGFVPEYSRGPAWDCIVQCFQQKPISPTFYRGTYRDTVLPCIGDCIENLSQKIQDWLSQLPDKETLLDVDARRTVNYGQMKQNVVSVNRELQQLKKLFEMPNFFWDILAMVPTFPGFTFPVQQQLQPVGFASPPASPNILQAIIDSIRALLDHVVKRNQELLQLLVGCECSNSTTNSTGPNRFQPGVKPVVVVPVVAPVVTKPVVPVVDSSVVEPVVVPVVSPVVTNPVVDSPVVGQVVVPLVEPVVSDVSPVVEPVVADVSPVVPVVEPVGQVVEPVVPVVAPVKNRVDPIVHVVPVVVPVKNRSSPTVPVVPVVVPVKNKVNPTVPVVVPTVPVSPVDTVGTVVPISM